MVGFLETPLLIFRRYYRSLGLRVVLYALLSLLMAVSGLAVEGIVPDSLSARIGSEAVMPVLTILASSMLAVSTFSLNVMVSAQNAASDRATPRIHRLMLEDTTTQSALAAFIGAFVFALTTIILFRVGAYDDKAAVLVMGVTILVVAIVIVAMLRWIDHLSRLGSLDNSLDLASDRAHAALRRLARAPALKANPLTSDTVLPQELTPVPAARSGYVQIVDVPGLANCLPDGAFLYVQRSAGRHVLAGQPLALVSGQVSAELLEDLSESFVLGDMRTDEQDPEFGLLTLSEISSKALSPGVNDPGTAIEAIARLEILLWEYAGAVNKTPEVRYPQIFVPVPEASRLVEAAFAATARDGAGIIEVALQLRQALLALTESADPALHTAAQNMAARALAYAEAALPLETERERLRNSNAR